MSLKTCQSMRIHHMSYGKAKLPPLTIFRRLKLELRRHLPPHRYRWLKQTIDRFLRLVGRGKVDRGLTTTSAVAASLPLQAGERVRVRSAGEIEATLDRWQELKGCGYMDDMWEFCGTQQRVLKPVQRFVDERDYQVKKVKGIVLLEGLTCKGTPILGRCDRNCHYFWREEWLERISPDREANRPM